MAEALDKILPPPRPLFDAFTGEILDPDDLDELKEHLGAIDEFLDGEYAKHRRVYESRARLRARIGQIGKPIDLPARRDQTDKQAKIERCPRCSTRLPRVVVTDAPEAE